MVANKANCVFQCLDQAFSTPFRLESWKQGTGERFSEIQPWLIPVEQLAPTVACEHTRVRGCRYRIVEHHDGSFTGVCDEGKCQRRHFEKSELIQYRPNFPRLRSELAKLIGVQPYASEPTHPCMLPIGDLAFGSSSYGVKLVGGLNQEVLERILRSLWMEGDQKQIIIFASSLSLTQPVAAFIRKAGWYHYSIEHSFALKPTTLSWEPEAQAYWLKFTESIITPEERTHEKEKHLAEAVRQGFANIGRNIHQLESENSDLKQNLSNQLSVIANQVEPEYLHWILTIMTKGSVSQAAASLNMANTTLIGKLKRYSDRGGMYNMLHDLLAVRRRGLGIRKLEHFNEDFLDHQNYDGAAGNEDLMEEVLGALEAQDETNWPQIRNELLEVIQEAFK